jgi:hypothetical protein
MKKFVIIAIVVVVVIAGALFYSQKMTNKNNQPLTKIATTTPSDLKNLTYIIEGQQITLSNGLSQISIASGSAETQTTRYFGNVAAGDLTNSGRTGYAFLLTQDNGGSGTFYYIVAALLTDFGYRGTNALLLGDRIAPQSTEINNGIITVNYADRKPGEPFTTEPSVAVSRNFRIDAGSLIEIK